MRRISGMEGEHFIFDSEDIQAVARVTRLLELPLLSSTGAVVDGELFDDSESEVSADEIENSDQSTDIEEEDDDVDIKDEHEDRDIVYGKDGITAWSTQVPPCDRKTLQRNTLSHLLGVKDDAKKAETPMQCWELLFDKYMLDHIVYCTNSQISLVRDKYSRVRDAKETDYVEIKALIGILYMMGKKKINRTNLDEIWANDMTGEEFIMTVMPQKRFKFLLQNLRFDDKNTHSIRETIDKLTAVRGIFERFVQNSQKHYSVGEYLTLDATLEGFKGRCAFRQCIPAKSSKYGIKIFALTDSRVYYTVNMEIYAGKQPAGPYDKSNSPHDVVMRLAEPVYHTERNITMGNWFTSFPLVKELLNLKLTVVGAVQKNKIELPPSVSNKNVPLYTSRFFFDKDQTLVAYHPKKDEVVIVTSTMHHDTIIDTSTGDKRKPNIVTFYDANKSAVDTVNQLCSTYDVSRFTRRWPMLIFYTLLNVAGINSLVIYGSNQHREYDKRRLFLHSLSFELVGDQVKRKLYTTNLPKELANKVQQLNDLIHPELKPSLTEQLDLPSVSKSRKRCYGCTRKANRHTSYQCRKCSQHICLKDHAVFVCAPCFRGDYKRRPRSKD